MNVDFEKLQHLRSKQKEFLGDEKNSSLYNSWRARIFTRKGKDAGFPDTWLTFRGFKSDIPEGFKEGLILVRKDSSVPFSKENCIWIEKSQQTLTKLAKLEYNGKTKTLLEWSSELQLNYAGVRQRYFKGKNYTPEQVLFGKVYKPKRDINDILSLNLQQQRDKISRMLSAYKHDDKRKGIVFNIDREFLTNLTSQACYYCGDTKQIGADRIDNNLGHTKDNIVSCCYTCNVVRSNLFSVEEMKLLGQTIKLIKENRGN